MKKLLLLNLLIFSTHYLLSNDQNSKVNFYQEVQQKLNMFKNDEHFINYQKNHADETLKSLQNQKAELEQTEKILNDVLNIQCSLPTEEECGKKIEPFKIALIKTQQNIDQLNSEITKVQNEKFSTKEEYLNHCVGQYLYNNIKDTSLIDSTLDNYNSKKTVPNIKAIEEKKENLKLEDIQALQKELDQINDTDLINYQLNNKTPELSALNKEITPLQDKKQFIQSLLAIKCPLSTEEACTKAIEHLQKTLLDLENQIASLENKVTVYKTVEFNSKQKYYDFMVQQLIYHNTPIDLSMVSSIVDEKITNSCARIGWNRSFIQQKIQEARKKGINPEIYFDDNAPYWSFR